MRQCVTRDDGGEPAQPREQPGYLLGVLPRIAVQSNASLKATHHDLIAGVETKRGVNWAHQGHRERVYPLLYLRGPTLAPAANALV